MQPLSSNRSLSGRKSSKIITQKSEPRNESKLDSIGMVVEDDHQAEVDSQPEIDNKADVKIFN